MKCDHSFVAVAFVFGGYRECEKCGHRPNEREWNSWAEKQAVAA